MTTLYLQAHKLRHKRPWDVTSKRKLFLAERTRSFVQYPYHWGSCSSVAAQMCESLPACIPMVIGDLRLDDKEPAFVSGEWVAESQAERWRGLRGRCELYSRKKLLRIAQASNQKQRACGDPIGAYQAGETRFAVNRSVIPPYSSISVIVWAEPAHSSPFSMLLPILWPWNSGSDVTWNSAVNGHSWSLLSHKFARRMNSY